MLSFSRLHFLQTPFWFAPLLPMSKPYPKFFFSCKSWKFVVLSFLHTALCVYPHCKVSIGQYTKMGTSPLIFFQFHYFRWQIFEENIWVDIWYLSWTQIFWIAQVTLFKYFIISNDYFTMNGFTEKDAILVIFCKYFDP